MVLGPRKLEDFARLIETAEKYSDTSYGSASFKRGRSVGYSSGQKGNPSKPVVPRLNLSWRSTGSSNHAPPNNLVGPAASHCGLTISDVVPSSRHSDFGGDTGRSSIDSSRHTPASGQRKSASTVRQQTCGTPSSDQGGTTSSNRDSSSPHHKIQAMRPNSPFVKKITSEVLAATRSPVSSPGVSRRPGPSTTRSQSVESNKSDSNESKDAPRKQSSTEMRRRPPRPRTVSSSPSPVRSVLKSASKSNSLESQSSQEQPEKVKSARENCWEDEEFPGTGENKDGEKETPHSNHQQSTLQKMHIKRKESPLKNRTSSSSSKKNSSSDSPKGSLSGRDRPQSSLGRPQSSMGRPQSSLSRNRSSSIEDQKQSPNKMSPNKESSSSNASHNSSPKFKAMVEEYSEDENEIEEDLSVEDLVTEINVEIKAKSLKEESPKRTKLASKSKTLDIPKTGPMKGRPQSAKSTRGPPSTPTQTTGKSTNVSGLSTQRTARSEALTSRSTTSRPLSSTTRPSSATRTNGTRSTTPAARTTASRSTTPASTVSRPVSSQGGNENATSKRTSWISQTVKYKLSRMSEGDDTESKSSNKKEYKPRPNNLRRRPQSAPSGGRKSTQDAKKNAPANLGEYSKSLKLLGVEVPSNRKQATILTHHMVQVETKEPVLKTRLMKRSESYSQLTETLQKGVSKKEFDTMRKDLKDAVFEQWYFMKYTEAKEAKAKRDAELEEKRQQEIEKQHEIQESSKTEYKKWLEKKKKEQAKKKLNVVVTKEEKIIDKKLIEKKTKEWMEAKKKEQKKKQKMEERKKKKEEKNKIEEEKKRSDASKVYLAWKNEKIRQLQDKIIKEQIQKEKEALKKKEEDELENKKEADIVFQGWKRTKDEKARKEREKKRQEELAKKQEEERKVDENANNVEEATKAYESWLDNLDKRFEEDWEKEEKEEERNRWRPPWVPAGNNPSIY